MLPTDRVRRGQETIVALARERRRDAVIRTDKTPNDLVDKRTLLAPPPLPQGVRAFRRPLSSWKTNTIRANVSKLKTFYCILTQPFE